jgi:hypothetical protein
MGKNWLLGVLAFGTLANAVGLWFVFTREPPQAAAPPLKLQQERASNQDLVELVRELRAGRETPTAAPAAEAPPDPTLDEAPPAKPAPGPQPKLSEVVDSVLNRETRDPEWATAVERRFAERAKASGEEVHIQRMQCGSTRCAAVLTLAHRRLVDVVPAWFGDGTVAFEGKPTEDGVAYTAVFAKPGQKLVAF